VSIARETFMGMETLIIAPLQEELGFFLQECARHEFRAATSALGRLPVVRLPELCLTLACGGTGKAQFALQAQHLLDSSSGWQLVMCAGAAGALADDLAVGDVVVATATLEHDYQNKFNSRPLPRFEGASSAIAGLREASSSARSFKVHFGTIASGDEDVVDPVRRMTLRQRTNALAVAWEGAGGARACQFSRVPYLEMRGITDAADGSAASDFNRNLKVAMTNIATLVLHWRRSRAVD
jgi:adenosylhomocysteine nucleosidase